MKNFNPTIKKIDIDNKKKNTEYQKLTNILFKNLFTKYNNSKI